MKTKTQYIVVMSAGALKFHTQIPTWKTIVEIVTEEDATRFDSMTEANLAAIPYFLEGYKIAPVSAHVPTAN